MDDQAIFLLSVITHDYPELADLNPDQLVGQLKSMTAEHNGSLADRQQAARYLATLSTWLIRATGCTDQLLFELLETLPDDYSNEYKSWSPEYSRPITNAEAKLKAR